MGIDRVGSCIRKNKVKVMMMMDEIEKEKKEAKKLYEQRKSEDCAIDGAVEVVD